MPWGLTKSTAYWNKVEARKDWNKAAQAATDAGHADLAELLKPADDAGWRKIDKATAALKKALEEVKA